MDVILTDFTYAPEAESYVIGALLKDPFKTITAIETLGCTQEWFQKPAFIRVFEAAMLLRTAGQPIEIDTIIDSLKQRKLWTLVGTECLHNAQTSCRSSHNASAYIQMLRDRYLKREILQQIEKASDMVNSETSGLDCLSQIRFNLSTVDKVLSKKNSVKDIIRSVEDKYTNAQTSKSVGISSRWLSLQAVLCGYIEGKMSIVASRPGQGKTTHGCNEMYGCINRPTPVPCGIVSMEMTEEEIREKLAADALDIDLKYFRQGRASNAQIIELANKIEDHSKEPIFISEGNKTIDQVGITLRDMASDGCKFVVIDYIQRIKARERESKGERERYANYSNELCNLANETGMHVMALCQLRREAEFDLHDKRILPRMEHLKGSGDFEQDAHQIVLIGRAITLQGDQEMSDNQPMVIKVSKNRNGGLSSGLDFVFAKSRQKLMPQALFQESEGGF